MIKEQIMVVSANHPPNLPSNHKVLHNSNNNNNNGSKNNGNASTHPTKKTDNSITGNSLETTERSSVGTSKSSPMAQNNVGPVPATGPRNIPPRPVPTGGAESNNLSTITSMAESDLTQRQILGSQRNGNNSNNNSLHGSLSSNQSDPLIPPDPNEQEQTLFEERLCEEGYGVAVRKINQYGKSNLRYVKCVVVDESTLRAPGKSVRSGSSSNSWGRNSNHSQQEESSSLTQQMITRPRRVLLWGKKKDVQVPLENFVCVRKGKTTERAKKNAVPASRVLSLITCHPGISLDIEAPTKMDRDKFARAFANFLSVPLEGEDNRSVQSADVAMFRNSIASVPKPGKPPQPQAPMGCHNSAPGDVPVTNSPTTANRQTNEFGSFFPPSSRPPLARSISDPRTNNTGPSSSCNNQNTSNAPTSSSNPGCHKPPELHRKSAIINIVPKHTSKPNGNENEDDTSHVSSLTGHGYDQELVEELHHALNELRSELEESRAEAARAVKVAEQAIQSAEKSNSIEWQNTVTHKAAEAAARAQKQSATAMAKARLAEERLEGERRTAQFWRKQAEVAEEEAGTLQTRAAAAEVQRAAIEEQLKMERRFLQAQLDILKERFGQSDVNQREALEAALERNRTLEVELDSTRRTLLSQSEMLENVENDAPKNNVRKKRTFFKKKGHHDEIDSKLLLAADAVSSTRVDMTLQETRDAVPCYSPSSEQLMKLHSEAKLMRQEFEKLRRATVDDVQQLPQDAKLWALQIGNVLNTSTSEVTRLQEQLAMESASRRKLLHEVQDLRGSIRVYCRPRFNEQSSALVSVASRDTLVVHREKFSDEFVGPTSFECDRVFSPSETQQEVYAEIEDVCLSVMDGYKICLMAYGQTGCGKTHLLLGDVQKTENKTFQIQDHGIQLRTMQQLFSVAEHRSDRYKDTFSLTIVEINDEKLFDLLGATRIGEERGEVVSVEVKNRKHKAEEDCNAGKLEIRTDVHGETVVQGLRSVNLQNFDEVMQLWTECLETREDRIHEQGVDPHEYKASSHLLVTLTVTSSNVATGTGSIGKIQFVDLASADIVRREPGSKSPQHGDSYHPICHQSEWRFANRSLETLSAVVEARCRFDRNVPYRNSTLTHLLQDSLEADTKVLFFACVSPHPQDMKVTTSTLRFASRVRRVNVGKATKHLITPP